MECFAGKLGDLGRKKGKKATKVCLKWDILQENWGTSGEKRAKSDRGVPEMGCFAGKLGDLGHEMDEKRPRCARGGGDRNAGE